MPYRTRTDEEIAEMAVALIERRLFTSAQVQEPHLISMIFLPLSLMDKKDVKHLFADRQPALLYANYNDALDRTVNGYPIFAACGWLDVEDAARLMASYSKLRKALKEAANERRIQ